MSASMLMIGCSAEVPGAPSGSAPAPDGPALRGAIASSQQALTAWDSIPHGARYEHAAVAIDAERVLVCGGYRTTDRSHLATCEVVDLSQRRALSSLALPAPRRFMTLTALAQGADWSVLAVGGGVGVNLVANALVGDPSGWAIEPFSHPSLARRNHTTTRLSDGSALIVGGDDAATSLVAPVWRRLPNGEWQGAGAQERTHHATALIDSSEGDAVVALGGFDGLGAALDSVAVYSGQTNSWTERPGLEEARGQHTATALDDGWVLIVGGASSLVGSAPLSSAWLYHVPTGEQRQANEGVSLVARVQHRAARLGRYVIVAGGLTQNPDFETTIVSSVQAFDSENEVWIDLLPLTTSRARFELTSLDERLVASGGLNDEFTVASAEVLQPLALGVECTASSDCISGLCVEGVCCESACSGACETCSGAQPGECVALDARPPREPLACGGFVCEQGECATACSADADCEATHFCNAGACTRRQPQGARCERSAQCASGFCTDNVCCESECGGQCEFCSNAGLCRERVGAPVEPREPCRGASDSECGATCNGFVNRFECVFPGSATACGAPSCGDGVEKRRGVCDGQGECDQEEAECGGYACRRTACLRSCEATEDCASGYYCDRATCRPECESEADCNLGQVCQDRQCRGPLCSADRSRVLGSTEPCTPYVCGWEVGACLAQCTSNWDCAPGHYCDSSGQCEESPLFDSSLKGCVYGGGTRAPGFGASALLLAALVAWRKRRSASRERRRAAP